MHELTEEAERFLQDEMNEVRLRRELERTPGVDDTLFFERVEAAMRDALAGIEDAAVLRYRAQQQAQMAADAEERNR